MSETLPKGWISLPLKEVGMPSTPNLDPSRYTAETFELFSVPSYAVHTPEYLSGSEIGSTKQFVEPDDVLLCKIVPHLNRVWKVPPAGVYCQIASGECIVIRSSIGASWFHRTPTMSPPASSWNVLIRIGLPHGTKLIVASRRGRPCL